MRINRRFSIHTFAILLLLPFIGSAQADSTSIPRMPWGHPDFQGFFTYRTITPLQRPTELGDKAVLTPEEAAEWAAKENLRQNRDLIDDKKGGAGYAPGVISYNEFWYERGDDVIESRRTSLIYDPPNGRMPPTAKNARPRRGNFSANTAGEIGVEKRPLAERCLMSFGSTVPMIPRSYNNNIQIVQTKDYIMILNEMIHLARVIPFTNTYSGMPKWEGDSIAHWDDDVLVIETTNFYYQYNFGGYTPEMKLVERISRVDKDTLTYDFTVTDPNTWTAPWSAKFPLRQIDEPIYEYACHEGNIGLESVLKGLLHEDEERAKQSGASKK